MANYYLAEKEIRMESRLKEVFYLLDEKNCGECSFRSLLSFGNFIGVEWTLLYLREAFNIYDGTDDSIVSLSQFLQFCVNELNGLDILIPNISDSFISHLQMFNYVVEGFIVFTNFDYRIKEELQQVKCLTWKNKV